MWFNRIRTLSLLLAFGAAVIPFVTYITDENRDLLWLLIGTNIFAYIMVALTTIRITLDVAGREKAKTFVPARWAYNPVMSKWYTAVRLSWKWHVLAAVARMGLAALWQQILLTKNYSCGGLLAPYCYLNAAQGHSQVETFIIGILILVFFALAETSLVVAVALLIQKRVIASSAAKIIAACGFRVALMMFTINIVAFCMPVYDATWDWRMYYATNGTGETIARIVETVVSATTATADTGILLAANVMRPVGQEIELTEEACQRYYQGLTRACWYDNRPFVARNIIAGLLGLMLYAGLTRLTLRLASRHFNGESVHV